MLRTLVDGGGTTVDLCGCGIADFGVSGLVAAVCAGSGLDLVEDARFAEFCAAARHTQTAIVTIKHTALHFVIVIRNSSSALPLLAAFLIRTRFS